MEENLKGYYAGFISRLVAYGVDIGVLVVAIMALTWLLRTTLELFNLEERLVGEVALLVLTGFGLFLIVSGYYVFFWSLLGQTPGKMLMGLQIVTLTGERITFWQAVRRFLGYIVSLFCLFAGFLWILIDNRRQGWHDKLAGTCVIYIWEAQPGTRLVAEIKKRQSVEELTE